jgi:hypothetical protein
MHPAELCGEQLLPFVPRLAEIDQRRDQRIVALAGVLAETVSTHAAATWILDNEPQLTLANMGLAIINAFGGVPPAPPAS